jgi:protein TonB
MKNIIISILIAFLISLVIHFLSFVTVNRTIKNNKLQINTTNKIENIKKNKFTFIKYVKLKKVDKIKKKSKKKSIIKKTKPKKTKKVVKKKTIIKPIKKKPTIIDIPINKPKIDLRKLFTIQKVSQVSNTQKTNKKELEDERQEIQKVKQLDKLTQSYIKLYGKQYFLFSNEEKRYIKSNISHIGKITQKHLRYPNISIRTKQQGINIVEFLFHPNGDISDLKITDSSHYTALDQNTIDTIEIAYKDYPKPSIIVKIKIYVRYILN